MYGKYVDVIYKETEYSVFVMCTPSTPQNELNSKALRILQSIEKEKGFIEVDKFGKVQMI